MKKLAFAVLVSMLASPVIAGDKNGFVFNGEGIEIISVSSLKNKKDDDKVKLKGKVEKSLGDEKYSFRDGTGTVVIEIDDDERFSDMAISSNDTVEIFGEVDKGWFGGVEIDVKNIRKVK